MPTPYPFWSHIFLLVILSFSLHTTNPLPNDILLQEISSKLHFDTNSITKASIDYGNIVHQKPSAVFYPSTINDVVSLVKYSNNCTTPFGISARGMGHSVRGQAMTRGGVVLDMRSLKETGNGIRVSTDRELGFQYADVAGGELWVDVLRATLERGVAPVSWTDYLYLSVGGTLSNGGISGQSFLHGPQINNVLELDVVTGKGDFITCSSHMNSELFFAVLGGLGQFGIITRARIILQKAPTRVRWMRLVYNDFSKFTSDQEHLISRKDNKPNYVEGSLITTHTPPNNWRSSFYSPSHLSQLSSLLKATDGHLYSIELVKYYDNQTAHTIDQDIEALLQDLNFIQGFFFEKDVPLIDFLTRVDDKSEIQLEEAHPWLNIFVPKSRIMEFNAVVFDNIIANHNHTLGPILFYPFNRNKWDYRMSAVTPDEDIFYTLGLLHSSRVDNWEDFDELNDEIIKFCERVGIEMKQYLPHYKSKEEWEKHFGKKWSTFVERKKEFDPRMILSRGQRIFSLSEKWMDM